MCKKNPEYYLPVNVQDQFPFIHGLRDKLSHALPASGQQKVGLEVVVCAPKQETHLLENLPEKRTISE